VAWRLELAPLLDLAMVPTCKGEERWFACLYLAERKVGRVGVLAGIGVEKRLGQVRLALGVFSSPSHFLIFIYQK
jgi:hypothetical protein